MTNNSLQLQTSTTLLLKQEYISFEKVADNCMH